jgi:hypothetical protein
MLNGKNKRKIVQLKSLKNHLSLYYSVIREKGYFLILIRVMKYLIEKKIVLVLRVEQK